MTKLNPATRETVYVLGSAIAHGGRMRFQHHGFNIDCLVERLSAGFIGRVMISRSIDIDTANPLFESDSLKSFSTEAQALGYARFWAEMWCDVSEGLR